MSTIKNSLLILNKYALNFSWCVGPTQVRLGRLDGGSEKLLIVEGDCDKILSSTRGNLGKTTTLNIFNIWRSSTSLKRCICTSKVSAWEASLTGLGNDGPFPNKVHSLASAARVLPPNFRARSKCAWAAASCLQINKSIVYSLLI